MWIIWKRHACVCRWLLRGGICHLRQSYQHPTCSFITFISRCICFSCFCFFSYFCLFIFSFCVFFFFLHEHLTPIMETIYHTKSKATLPWTRTQVNSNNRSCCYRFMLDRWAKLWYTGRVRPTCLKYGLENFQS